MLEIAEVTTNRWPAPPALGVGGGSFVCWVVIMRAGRRAAGGGDPSSLLGSIIGSESWTLSSECVACLEADGGGH